jgi:hypothetical protein
MFHSPDDPVVAAAAPPAAVARRAKRALVLSLFFVLSITLADRALSQGETANTPYYDIARAVAARDAAVYLAGDTGGNAFVRKYDEDGAILWERRTRDSDATGIAVDMKGNVVVAGSTRGDLAGNNEGGPDAYVRKYSKDGAVLWTRQFGSAQYDSVNAVCVDADGNIYVAGYVGWGRAFLRKYSPFGAKIWTEGFDEAGIHLLFAVAADSEGNVFVAGSTEGDLAGTNQGYRDAFVRKYNASGAMQWTRQFGTDDDDVVYGVAIDGTGAAIVAGYTGGSFPGFSNLGGIDAFVRKYSSSGQLMMTDQFGAAYHDVATSISTDPANNFYVAGSTEGTLGSRPAGGIDAFVRKYASNNAPVWLRQFGTAATDAARAIAAASIKIYVAGSTAGALGGANQGKYDAFLRRLNQNGVAVWTDQ